MNQPSESEFVRELLTTDQPVCVDVTGLTDELVAIRRQRKQTRQARIGVAAVATVVCAAALVVAGPFLQTRPTAPAANAPGNQLEIVGNMESAEKNELVDESTTLSPSWEFGELENYQQRLASIKSEVADLRIKSKAHQLTILKENLSRDFFDKVGYESVYTNF